MPRTLVFAALLSVVTIPCLGAPAPASGPLLRTVDLDRGEVQEVELADGTKAKVKLIDIEETRDGLRSAIRQARVKVAVNGEEIVLISATYHLPTAVAGVQIDCPVTKGHYLNCDPFEDSWGLDRDARLRLWPAGSPWTVPGTFVYPVAQRWFASGTQMANEPSFVDGGDAPSGRKIYYHSGLDIGGCEGRVDVVAASEGLVVSAGGETLPEYPEVPFYKRAAYDCVYILDAQGWFYRYAHLKSIDPAVRPGQRVKVGQKLGLLGKEGSSGGWSHLHFDIKSRQPSGKWGIQEGYAFIWEAYQREYRPKLVAVARPHHLASVEEKVALDASRSWSALGPVLRHEWTFTDGAMAVGPRVERTYDRPGCYSEVLKVTDSQGRTDLDFAVVQVLDKSQPENLPSTIHASFAPTLGIRPGQPVTFQVRSFRTAEGSERWDFGDGSPPATVQSDGNARPMAPDGYAETVHRYAKPGLYLVRVERAGSAGARAIAHLQVRVGDEPCEPAAGPLRVSDKNPRYFSDGSGRVVYLTGSHTWNNLLDMGRSDPPEPFDFDAYLGFLERHGHNFIRLWTWDTVTWDTKANGGLGKDFVHRVAPLPWPRTGPGKALDGKPKFDLSKFDAAYFERLRARVRAAGRCGIYVSVMLFEGWELMHANRGRAAPEGWAWRGHPFHPQNNLNGIDARAGTDGIGGVVHSLTNPAVNAIQAAYIKKVVDAVNDLDNVLYEVINEGGGKEWDWWVVKTVRDHERTKPRQHPVGITGHGAERIESMLASSADWISPGRADGYAEDPPAWEGKKVSLLDTDHVWGVGGSPAWVWKSFVRGHNPIFMDPYDNAVLGKSPPEGWDELRRAMGHARKLAERVDLAAMAPRDDLSSTKYCLAQPGVAYVVYLPEGGAAVVELSGVSGPFEVEWLHPIDGTVTRGEPATGGGKRTFNVPFSGPAVLHLRRG